MKLLPQPPTLPELRALAMFAQSQQGDVILGWLRRNAEFYLEASTDTASDSRSRQTQGAWMALAQIVETASNAPKTFSQTEHS